MLPKSAQLVRRFRRDQRGNVAVIFALSLVPVLSCIGCAIDYSRATQMRSKLQAAIDAASVGSVSKKSPAFIAAGSMTSDGPIPAGVTDATNIFNGNMSGTAGYTLNSMSAVVTKSGGIVTSTTTFSAAGAYHLHERDRQDRHDRHRHVERRHQYAALYRFLSAAGQFPFDGRGRDPGRRRHHGQQHAGRCAFACHDLNDTNNYYKLAKTLGVTTRIDVLRTATQQLMDTAASTQTYSSQFRMAIYDFGGFRAEGRIESPVLVVVEPSSAKTAAGNIDLMTVNGQNDNNDQDTNYTDVFPAINSAISAPGAGTSSAPQKYLFFVSDGVADENIGGSCLKPTTGGRCQSPINPALCTAIKNRGIKIAVLYTTYLALPTNAWYNTWIAPFNPGPYGPSPNSEIAQQHGKLRIPGALFRSQPDPGYFAGDEYAVSKSGRRRPHQPRHRRHPEVLAPWASLEG